MSSVRPSKTRLEQKELTRALLLKVGRKVFAKHGYDATSIALVCRAARVTHGALYHHFASKTELFAAVLQELSVELAARVDEAAASAEGWAGVEAACRAYLDACADPAVMAILFRDAPRVLAPETFERIDEEANAPVVTRLLQGWIDDDLLRPVPVVLVAHMLGGAFAEAGSAIAGAQDPGTVRGEAEAILLSWLATFRRVR